jgi:undecaprenyl-diphosphatase
MPIIHAIILGITQGLSEFLPISSSGHLLLVPWLFGWNDFLVNGVHSDSLEKTFDVALHIGTLIGAIAYFRADILTLIRAAFTRNAKVVTTGTLAKDHPTQEDDRRLAWLLIIASIPGAVIGALFEKTIEDHLGQIWLIGVMLIVFGLVLYFADKLLGERRVVEFRLRDALIMGAGQALALSPGVSRSGITMTFGRWLRFDRDAAARLSFLMAIPITGGAVLFKTAKMLHDGFPSGFAGPFIWGIIASGLTGYAAVWGLLKLIRSQGFTPFVIYRVVAGTAIIALYVTGAR